jgi:hypothetical protein
MQYWSDTYGKLAMGRTPNRWFPIASKTKMESSTQRTRSKPPTTHSHMRYELSEKQIDHKPAISRSNRKLKVSI